MVMLCKFCNLFNYVNQNASGQVYFRGSGFLFLCFELKIVHLKYPDDHHQHMDKLYEKLSGKIIAAHASPPLLSGKTFCFF
jgi:hypothetical protein